MASLDTIYDYLTDRGIVVPDTSTVKSLVETAFQDALGVNLNVSEETPVGRLVELMVSAITGCLKVNAQNASQFNPYSATGAWLDAIGKLFSISRLGATRTTATVTITGVAGATIPSGTVLETSIGGSATGNYFETVEAITLSAEGTGDVGVQAQETGSISAGAGTITVVVSSNANITSVTNSVAGESGRDIETDESLRDRILNGRSHGVGTAEAIRSAILEVSGVKSCVVYENGYGSDHTINGVNLAPHTVFICVEVSSTTDTTIQNNIARAIIAHKTAGCGYTAIDPVSVTIGDNTAKYKNPTSITGLSVNISVRQGGYTGTNISGDITTAITDYVSSLGVGRSLTVYGISGAVMTSIPSIIIDSLAIVNNGTESSSIDVSGAQIAAISGVAVTVNA